MVGVSRPGDLLEGCADSLADGECVFGAGVGHDECELFAAVSAGDVGLADFASEETGESGEDRVACGVTVGVVDEFESIDIEDGE